MVTAEVGRCRRVVDLERLNDQNRLLIDDWGWFVDCLCVADDDNYVELILHPISRQLKVGCLRQSIPHLTRCILVTEALGTHIQGPRHHQHIRCLSGVWSGITLC